MNIPDFPLPSDPNTIIKFRTPTVSDCMSFVDLDPDFEEQVTTQYLNQIQVGELNDSGNWTGEDRRTALWWIFISTKEDRTLAFSYLCPHCGETHYPTIDMTTLGETAVSIDGLPYRKISFHVGEQIQNATVHPLTGFSLEHLEKLRNWRDSLATGTKEKRHVANKLSFYELLHSFDLDGQPADQNEALEYKKKIIDGMEVDTEFYPFAAKVEKALREMTHGILTKYDDAGYLILANRKACCEKEEKDRMYPILLPFRAFSFLPKL